MARRAPGLGMWSAAKGLLRGVLSLPDSPVHAGSPSPPLAPSQPTEEEPREASSEPPQPCGEVLAVVGPRRFFGALTWRGQRVGTGSFVKVFLEDSDPDGEALGVGVVLTIHEADDDVLLEVRWFSKPKELRLSKRKM